MNALTTRPKSSVLARTAALAAAALLVAGCVSSSAASGSSPSAAPPDSPGISTPSSGAPSGGAFYLRAWTSQALAPRYTFGSMPPVTIADGQFYDGVVAIPMIYPGPLYTALSTRTISAAGIDKIVAEATADGLMGSVADFGQVPPGGISCDVEITVNGVTRELTGPCPPASDTANAPGAYGPFWTFLTGLGASLAADLGPSVQYTPTRLAVMAMPPAADPSSPIAPTVTPWPLAAPFESFGSAAGSVDYRCAVVTGSDLATLLPVVKAANALTQFRDSAGLTRSLQLRVLTPGDPGPC